MAEAGHPTSSAEHGHDVAVLDHALWSKLETSDDLADFGAAWLALLCQRIGGASRAVLILRSDLHGQLEPFAYWPKGRAATAGLSSAAETALRENRGVARAPKSDTDNDHANPQAVDVAQPIRLDGDAIGIVAVEISNRPKEALAVVMRDLQWGAAWIVSAFREREHRQDRLGQDRLRLAVELFSATLAKPRFSDACRTFATELATELDCDRVTVTRRRRKLSRAVAISNSATFDRRTNLIRAIERATDEAIDQWHTIMRPDMRPAPNDDGTVQRAQAEVEALNGGLATMATPIPIEERAVGGLFLEREAGNPFSEQDVLFVETLAALVGPALEEKRLNDRLLIVKAIETAANFLGSIFGPRYLGRKIAVAAIVLAVSYLVLSTKTYRVSADARLTGIIERAISVPFDGYLDSADVLPGDIVLAGQPLAQLDTRDLEIERLRRLSERNQSVVEYDQALAGGDRAGLNVLRARIGQADAQIALLEAQIERTELAAPFDGVVVSGDNSQRIGDAVERGEVLYEIAPLNEYRVRIAVDERDVEEIKAGQRGWLALSAFPEAPFEIEILRVSPVSEQENGLNFFQVDAAIQGEADRQKMRPGMDGVAKIEIEERRLIWIWSHRLIDWARLALWRWRA